MAERENIRSRLKKHQLTQVWLINQLGLRGIVTDKTEMSSVLAGTRSGSKADAIIELSHDILDKYEACTLLNVYDPLLLPVTLSAVHKSSFNCCSSPPLSSVQSAKLTSSVIHCFTSSVIASL